MLGVLEAKKHFEHKEFHYNAILGLLLDSRVTLCVTFCTKFGAKCAGTQPLNWSSLVPPTRVPSKSHPQKIVLHPRIVKPKGGPAKNRCGCNHPSLQVTRSWLGLQSHSYRQRWQRGHQSPLFFQNSHVRWWNGQYNSREMHDKMIFRPKDIGFCSN